MNHIIKFSVLGAVMWFGTSAWAADGEQPRGGLIADDIAKFMSAAGTKVFPESGIEWVSKSDFIRHGDKLSDGSCLFSSGADADDVSREYSVLEEIAVNRETCTSVVRAGTPTKSGWERLRMALGLLGGKKLGNKPSVINSDTGGTPARAAAASTTPGEDTYTYSIQFTDGNNFFITDILNGLLGSLGISASNGINAGTVNTTVNYKYDPATAVESTGCASVSQASLLANKPSPGSFSWSVPSGGSCFSWSQIISSQKVTQYMAWDKDGNGLTAAEGKQLCDPYVPKFQYCSENNKSYSLTSSIGANSHATFYNNSSLAPFYDCSMGISLIVPYAYVYASPRSLFHASGAYQIVGGEDAGNTYKCRSNIKIIETGSTGG